jgi:hypothetical protein
VGEISGIDPVTFNFVMSWKTRLMFIQQDTAKVWYLPPDQIAGAATVFDFGPLLIHGGSLAMMASWTLDDGSGISDKLVLFGTQGDVLVYEGLNISDTASFRMVGRWFIGRVPSHRRFADRYGGDLFVLSARGLTSMNELIQLPAKNEDKRVGAKINRQIARQISQNLTSEFWEIRFFYGEQIAIINYPSTQNLQQTSMLIIEVNAEGWSTIGSYPSLTVEVFDGQLYGTDSNGAVWQLFYGDQDNVRGDVPGTVIEGELQTAFQPHGEAIRLKTYHQVLTQFTAPSPPSILVQMNTDWSFASIPGAPANVEGNTAKWDEAKWDQAVWAGESDLHQVWSGVDGMGYYGSLRMKVRGNPGTIFMAWKSLVTPGGIM